MQIHFHPKFSKRFNSLSRKTQTRFHERLALFLADSRHPLLTNHSVEKAYPGWRSINVNGDYRALFAVIGPDNVVFMRIGTHAELYK